MARVKSLASVESPVLEEPEALEGGRTLARKSSHVRLKRLRDSMSEPVHPDTLEVTFSNNVEQISFFVDDLLRGHSLTATEADALGLALRELLLNAMEHGNLAFSFEEKADALQDGTWREALRRRARQMPYGKRSVRVAARWSSDEVSFEIADEGKGFDWRALPDPSDPTNILRDNGRGVLMARLSVDRLEFNEKGNRVTITKRLGSG